MKQLTNCENCNVEFEADIQICCTSASADCGCLGLPVNGPIVCSSKCYDELQDKITKTFVDTPKGKCWFDVVAWQKERDFKNK